MDKKLLGKQLAAYRKTKKLTQEDLGERLGVSNKTVSRWETGVVFPDGETLLALASLYGVSVNDLLSAPAEAKDVKEDPFTIEERIAFWKQNFLAENKSWLWLSGVFVLALLLFGIVFKKPWLVGLAPAAALLLYGFWHNRCCAYAEQNAYRKNGR